MKFYGRQEELQRLAEISERAATSGYFTMISGRRRVGKTTLVKHFLAQQNLPACYFFVSRKQPRALLSEFAEVCAEQFPDLSGLSFENFDAFFRFLFQKLKTQSFTFVLDEFQNFQHVDPAVFSILQKHWDEHKDGIRGHIIVIGSLQTLMHNIFEDRKEPLFRRLTGKLLLQPLTFPEVRQWCEGHGMRQARAQVELYLLFSGMPFYYYLMAKEHLFGKSSLEILARLALRHDGLLFNEGKELTIEELGVNYGRYFSILEAIASGHTQWNNIATQCGIPPNSLGKYVEELQNYYGLIEKGTSVFSRENGKTSRYYLRDNFLAFWFRYVYKNASMLEEFSGVRLLPKIQRDLPNFFGFQFEKFVRDWLQRQCLKAPEKFPFDLVGGYWDKGENEIDVVAFADNDAICLVGECKWSSKRVSLALDNELDKALAALTRKRTFGKIFKAVFVGDKMPSRLRERLQRQQLMTFDVEDYAA